MSNFAIDCWIATGNTRKSPNQPGGVSRRKGRPSQRWADQVTKNASTLGVRNWRQAAIARDVWRRNLAEAKTCNRL